MTRLLLVEDEERLARSLSIGLQDEGYLIDHARDGEEALWRASSGLHDALILDVRLPKLDGLEVCRRLRRGRVHMPILFLTACDTPSDVVVGLDRGGDDYLTKPFDFRVLLARLRALLRRGTGGTPCISIDDLVFDPASRAFWRGGELLELSKLELRLLEHFLRHTGELHSKARLAAALWEDELGPPSNMLEVLVSSLRRKLDCGSRRRLLHTRRGQGYVLAVEVP